MNLLAVKILDKKNLIRHSGSSVIESDFNYIKTIVDTNYIGPGPLTADLVNYALSYSRRNFAIPCDSGTDALQIILHLLKTKSPLKKKVVLSSYACPSLISAIQNEGLEAVLVDTHERSMNMGSKWTSHFDFSEILAIVCTHIAGIPDDIETLCSLKVPVISDCAQALGTELKGKNLLSWGDFSLTSFGPTKYITGGQGGMLFCNNQDDFQLMQKYATPELSSAEYERDGFHPSLGQHPNDLNSGLILSQWKRIADLKERRRTIADTYDQSLKEKKSIILPQENEMQSWNRFRYYFFTADSSEVISKLQGKGIDARSSVSHNLSKDLKYKTKFNHIENLSLQLVSIPIYPFLSDEEVDFVVKALREIL